MDNLLLDVALGLLLVYLVLALMVTKLQETFFGVWGRSRQRTLHDMLDEALGRDGDIKARLLSNPAIAGLFKGPVAKNGLLTTGPSAIPGDLFARALLVALNDDRGDHPSVRFAGPRLFIEKKADSAKPVWGALRTLLAGAEGQWPPFEAAIARWWDQIGERASGWYQRKALRRSFWVAFGVAAAFNASTFQLVERLGTEPETRQALSSLAQRVSASSGSQAPGLAGGMAATEAAGATVPMLAAPLRAELALERAHGRVAEQFFGRQRSLASFELKRQALVVEDDAIAKCADAAAATRTVGATTKSSETWWLSDAQTWLQLLPSLRRSIKEARMPEGIDPPKDKPATPRSETLRQAYLCIGNLVGWVTTAAAASADSTAASSLQAAAAELNQAADALLEMLENRRTGILVRELFRTDPAAFRDCAALPGMSRERLAGCMATAAGGTLNLPLGWTTRNLRQALCSVAVLPAISEQTSTCPGNGDAVFEGQAGMNLSRMVLVGPSLSDWLLLLAGFVVTAVFVSLGAPFWFDLLGRVVKLRAAGTRPGSTADKPLPPAPQAPVEPAAAGRANDAAEPFSDARNDFERILTASDKVTLQQLLGVTASGTLDMPTRSALVRRARELKIDLPDDDQLSLQAFTRITEGLPAALEDRHRTESRSTTAPPPLSELAARLAAALALRTGTGSDDQRALSVLYVFKSQRRQRQPGQALDELDICRAAANAELADAEAVAAAASSTLQSALAAADSQAALPAFAREVAPWMDWALGELGQSERGATTRAGSNPRVLSYLEAGGLGGEFGDQVDWCAGFICWVLARRAGEAGDTLLPPRPQVDPLRAKSWLDWGEERPVGQAQAGDVIVLRPDINRDAHHVAFVLDRQDDRVWVIGGNQRQAQGLKRGVTVTNFGIANVVGVRRPG